MNDPFAPVPSVAAPTFDARYPGTCNACGAWFEAGTLVTYEDDLIVEAECSAKPKPVAPACPQCFQVHGAGWPPC